MPHCLLHNLPSELLDRILLYSCEPVELFYKISRTDKRTFSRYLSSDAYWKGVSQEWCGMAYQPFSENPLQYPRTLTSPPNLESAGCLTSTSFWYHRFNKHAMIPFFWSRKKFIPLPIDSDGTWKYVTNSEWHLVRWKRDSLHFQVLDPTTRELLSYELPNPEYSIVNVTAKESWIVLEAKRNHIRNELMFYVWSSKKQEFIFPPTDPSVSHHFDETANYKYVTSQGPFLITQKIPREVLSSECQIWDLYASTNPVYIPIPQPGSRPFIDLYQFFYRGILTEFDDFEEIKLHPTLSWVSTLTNDSILLWRLGNTNEPTLTLCGQVDFVEVTKENWTIERNDQKSLEAENIAWNSERKHLTVHLVGSKLCVQYTNEPLDSTLQLAAYNFLLYDLPSMESSPAVSLENFERKCHKIRLEISQTSKIEENNIIEMPHLNLIIISYREDIRLRFIFLNVETLQVNSSFSIEVNATDNIHIRKMSKYLNFLLIWTDTGVFSVVKVLNPSILGSFSLELSTIATSNISFVAESQDGRIEEYLLDFS
ncbi:hypothetical protein K7432_008902 [Basidiobolus ranarum]|uniref:F-box domain-containing protein n=1 Tax=Basidiobolus ranarum TaxID=34480 RepID=A0ABR2VXX4_9FUNG